MRLIDMLREYYLSNTPPPKKQDIDNSVNMPKAPMPPPRVNFTAGPIVPTSSVGTRNIEVLSNYFLGKDPALKETLASNSLRLIGIDGRCFVLRSELISRLNELKEYVNDKDATLEQEIQDVIDSLDGVSDRVTDLENWQSSWGDPTDYVLVDDLVEMLTNYYTKSEANALLNSKQNILTPGNNISIDSDTISVVGDVTKILEDNVYIKNLSKGIYRVRANHSISYSDLASATPLTYTYDVYLIVVEESRSKKTFYVVSGNYIVTAGYSREVVTSWVGNTINIDTSKIQSTANLVTTVSSSSTDAKYPSAKAVYDFVNEDVTSISSQEVEEIFTL